MYKLVIISCLLLVTTTFPLSAATIKNQINIKTNTGGNTINGETDGESVTTGDTSTSINIRNGTNTTISDSSKQTTDSNTSISVESTGGGESSVDMVLDGKSYTITSENGVTTVTTTTADGETQTETLEDGSEYRLEYPDGSSLEILSDEKGFNLTQENAHITTTIPLTVDTQAKTVSTSEDNIQLRVLPQKAQEKFLERFTDLSDMIDLVRNNNQLSYVTEGYTRQKILGLISTKIYFSAQQSATETNGEVSLSYKSFRDRLVDSISF